MLPNKTIKHWNALQDSVGGILHPVSSEAHYDQLAKLLDNVLDTVRGDENHALHGLLEVITRLIQDYDTQHPLELAAPEKMLEFYMRQKEVNQVQLASVTGVNQSLISKHLLGKRDISLAKAKVYAQYFRVPLESFISH